MPLLNAPFDRMCALGVIINPQLLHVDCSSQPLQICSKNFRAPANVAELKQTKVNNCSLMLFFPLADLGVQSTCPSCRWRAVLLQHRLERHGARSSQRVLAAVGGFKELPTRRATKRR